MGIKKTKEQFIEQAKLIHGDKYDYSKVEYVNNITKVEIICPEHGSFLQSPIDHLRGHGCNICGGTKKITTKEFINKAKKVHGDIYDYSKVNYINNSTKVEIVCPEHGSFWQTPSNHLSGKRCPVCMNKFKHDTDWFIQKAKLIHGNKYDYSKVEYVNNHTNICIICPEHGEFWQTPNNHLDGKGCKLCSISRGEDAIRNFLIENNIKFESQKIFKSCRNIKPLSFDFYLPDCNLCIEFQGIQHFKAIDFFGGDEQLNNQQTNDSIKRDWCSKKENPDLLEIDYTEFDSIEEILTKNLKDFIIN